MNEIQINLKNRKLRKEWLKSRAEAILKALQIEGAELSILITHDDHIRELNRAYRGKDRATDVLSFPNGDKVADKLLLGDVVISVDTASRQAEELGVTLEEEVERLLVHGIVHLLGYDHELGEREREEFERIEGMVLSEIRKR